MFKLYLLFLSYLFTTENKITHATSIFNSAIDVFDSFSLPHRDRFVGLLNEITSNASLVSTSCRASLGYFAAGLRSRDNNCTRIFSSFSKTQPGFVANRISDFGHYDLCMETSFNGTDPRYVLLELVFPPIEKEPSRQIWYHSIHQKMKEVQKVMNPLTSFCIPSTCSNYDIDRVLSSEVILKRIHPLRLYLHSTETYSEDPFKELALPRFIAKVILAFVVTVTLVASVWRSTEFVKNSSILSSFDAVETTRRIFSDGRGHEDDRFYIFNLYKTVYALLGILAHSQIIFTMEAKPFLYSALYMGVKSGLSTVLSVCAMFLNVNYVVSASLAVVTLVPLMDKISLPVFILGRALRTIPVLAAFVLLNIAFPLGGIHGRGPMFIPMQKNLTENCLYHGWKDLIFMTNTVPIEHNCNLIAWFVAVDMKIYCASFFIFYFLKMRPKIGYALIGVQIMIGTLLHYYNLYTIPEGISALAYIRPMLASTLLPMVEASYFDARGYITTYSVGILLGMALLSYKKKSKPSLVNIIASIIGFVLSIGIFVSVYDNEGNLTWERENEVLLACIIRLCIIAPMTVYFYETFFTMDILINFAKKKFFAIGSRFSFSMFMTHTFFLSYIQSELSRDEDYTSHLMLMRGLYIYILSIPAAYLMMIFVEYPAGNLVLKYFSKKRKTLEGKKGE